jgi:hypothetical protein
MNVPFAFDFMDLIFNNLFVFFSSLSASNYLFLGSGLPARTLPYALFCFYLGSSWAPCHWLLLLGRVGERRLSLIILFIIFWPYTHMHLTKTNNC